MATSRRRPTSVKFLIAVGLIAIAATVAAVALFTATVPALKTATVLGVLAGIAAVALLSAEVAVVRRLWAFDRASLADSYREHATRQNQVQAQFADQMTEQLQRRDDTVQAQAAQLSQLRTQAVELEIQTALAHERLAEEKARLQALQSEHDVAVSDLDSAKRDLLKAQDALAASEAASVATHAEMVAWEQALAAEKADAARGVRRSVS